MNAIKISRPFAAAFSSLLNGNAVSITADEASELDNTSNAYGDKFRMAIALFNEHVSI